MTNRRRWDIDKIGHGIGSGDTAVPGTEALLAALRLPDWIAEQPEAHLLPHLQSACERPGAPFALVSSESQGVDFVVTLEWRRERPNGRQLTVDVYALLGTVAEGNTFVQERYLEDAVEFLVATGMLDGETMFAGHGHVLKLRCTGAAIEALLRRRG